MAARRSEGYAGVTRKIFMTKLDLSTLKTVSGGTNSSSSSSEHGNHHHHKSNSKDKS